MERQIKLNFEASTHTYSDDTGKVYTSVTTLIGKYKEPFNKRYWSMYTALKNSGFRVRPSNDLKTICVDNKYRSLDSLYSNPINSQEVNNLINHWKHLTEVACERGNNTHDYLEDSINESKGDDGRSNAEVSPQFASAMERVGMECIRTQHDLDRTSLRDMFPAIYDRLLQYINMGCTLYAEKRIYTVQYGIAGMIDVLVVKGKWFSIVDWKTNKDVMMFRSGYFKKVNVGGKWIKSTNFIYRPKYLYKPLDNIEDCKGMIYSLQLSLYAYIMELWGYKLVPHGLEIFHMRPNCEPQLIKIDYKKEAIASLLEHHLTGGRGTKQPVNNLFGIT